MALMERVSTLLRANLNDLIDRAEDPAKMIRQVILDMENQLMQVKTQVAIAIVDASGGLILFHKLDETQPGSIAVAQGKARAAALFKRPSKAMEEAITGGTPQESDDELRENLAKFYAERSLTQTPIEPDDQAEAIFLLLSARLSKTTGHVIPVDGGLQDGFLR